MGTIHLLSVGKLQDPHLLALEKEYVKRLARHCLAIHETTGPQLIKKISQLGPGPLYLLAENGKDFASSDTFAIFLQELRAQAWPPIFVLGAASGHAPEVRALPHTPISLSPLTFPHQWARILFVEQVYRAQCIQLGHPYHR